LEVNRHNRIDRLQLSRVKSVGISYHKLREKKFDSGKKWSEIKKEIGVSNEVIARINKDQYVSLQTLEMFCEYFNCDFGDLISYKQSKK